MTTSDPNPRYPFLRIFTLAVAALALTAAMTGIAASGSVLAWAVAAIALTTFGASFYLDT